MTSSGPDLPAEEKGFGGNLTIFRAPVLGRTERSVASILSMLSFYPSSVRVGKRLIAEHKYDVINTWFAIPSGPTGSQLSRSCNIPHLLTVVGGDIYDPSKWYSPHCNPLLRPIVRKVLHSAHNHLTISHDVARRAKEYYDFEPEIEVVPLGIRPFQFRHCSRKDIGLEEEKLYIIATCRLVRRKNLNCLLEALSLLKEKNVEVVVVGDGPELNNLQTLAQKLNIANRVHFRGFVSDELKYQLLSHADLFVLPSLHEGFGLVYLEAMQCGLPIIATKIGGQEDFLQDGKTGLLVKPNDPLALRDAIVKLVEQKDLRELIRKYNSVLVQDYTVEKCAQKFEKVLKDTLTRVA